MTSLSRPCRRCWITFLGPHGHCEAGAKEYPLYNSDDTPEGYEKHGSSTSKSREGSLHH